MKTVEEVLTKIKGEGNVNVTLTNKGAHSQQGFGEIVNALINDTTFKIQKYSKDGKPTETINISEMIRADLKKTAEMANFPGPTEKGIYDTCPISTTNIAKAIPEILTVQLQAGKKIDLPPQKDMVGSIFLAPAPAKTKVTQVKDFKTQEPLGTSTTTTQDHIQLRAKSPAPRHLQTKVRKDNAGNIVK